MKLCDKSEYKNKQLRIIFIHIIIIIQKFEDIWSRDTGIFFYIYFQNLFDFFRGREYVVLCNIVYFIILNFSILKTIVQKNVIIIYY